MKFKKAIDHFGKGDDSFEPFQFRKNTATFLESMLLDLIAGAERGDGAPGDLEKFKAELATLRAEVKKKLLN